MRATGPDYDLAGQTVGVVAGHLAKTIGLPDQKPAVAGHSFGGLLTMIIAGRGLSAASVAIDSAPFRGVLPLPVSAPGRPIFQAATANVNPWTGAQADTKNPARGPLLIISGDADHVSPPAINKAAFTLQSRNPGVTGFASLAGHAHGLTVDSGWREVCDSTLAFMQKSLQL